MTTEPSAATIDEQFDELDRLLLDQYQHGFPVCAEPFDQIGTTHGFDPDAVVTRVRSFVGSGLVRRVGPVLDPGAIGASTLAALRVPDEDVEAVASILNEYPQVTHNYQRAHEWTLWFVLTARSADQREQLLDDIDRRTGYEPLSLPKQRTYCVDMQFPVVQRREENAASPAPTETERAPGTPTEADVQLTDSDGSLTTTARSVLAVIQDGIPVSRMPFADVATRLDQDAATVRATIQQLLEAGYIKRFGLVLNHRQFGYDANCMVAWAVPDDEIDAVGPEAGAEPSVTKCYHRPARPDRGWEYTLFTMIHARDPGVVEETVERLATGLLPYPHERLETVERFKQTGTRYGQLLGEQGAQP